MNKTKIGLVLSGGGAKGAFQAGVIDSFKSQLIDITAVSGTSIGSVNGAWMHINPNRNMSEFWLNLPEEVIASTDLAKDQSSAILDSLMKTIRKEKRKITTSEKVAAFIRFGGQAKKELKNNPSKCRTGRRILRKVNEIIRDRVEKGPIISSNTIKTIKDIVFQGKDRSLKHLYFCVCPAKFTAGRLNNMKQKQTSEVSNMAEYINISELETNSEIFEFMIASMAIPLLIHRKNAINPTRYLDGGIADNTPIEPMIPLIEQQSIDGLIVVSLEKGPRKIRKKVYSKKIRKKYPIGIIHLNSSSGRIGRKSISDMVDFSKVEQLYELGLKAGQEAYMEWFDDQPSPKFTLKSKRRSGKGICSPVGIISKKY